MTQEFQTENKKIGRPKGSKDKKKRKVPVRKKTKKVKKPKRIRCFSYEEAQIIVRDNLISSKGDYDKWWRINYPARMPKRPDRAYKKIWKGWGHFLGVYNFFSNHKRNFLPYEDAKAYVQNLGIKNSDDWRRYWRTHERPSFIPSIPPLVYKAKGEWLSWSEFLGTKMESKLDSIKNRMHYLYIFKSDGKPLNIFKIKVTFEHPTAISRYARDECCKILAIYKIPDFHTTKSYANLISKFCSDQTEIYGPSEYSIVNIHEFAYELDSIYRKFTDPY